MQNQEKASDLNLADLTENEQGREEIISIKKDVSFTHKNEQQPQKEAWANVQENRKWCLEKFVETKWRTGETNNEKHTKKKKRTRQSWSETIESLHGKAEKDLELKREGNSFNRMQEEHLRVFSQNQFQLFGQIIMIKENKGAKLQIVYKPCNRSRISSLSHSYNHITNCNKFLWKLKEIKRKMIEKNTVFSPVKLSNKQFIFSFGISVFCVRSSKQNIWNVFTFCGHKLQVNWQILCYNWKFSAQKIFLN